MVFFNEPNFEVKILAKDRDQIFDGSVYLAHEAFSVFQGHVEVAVNLEIRRQKREIAGQFLP